MLVLTRKCGQKVTISGGITITVVRVGGDRVRLAFEAPDHLRVLRAELARRGPAPATGPGPGRPRKQGKKPP